MRYMMMECTRRVIFDINSFLLDLENSREEESILYVEDVVERYENFLQTADGNLKNKVVSYLYKQPLVLENKWVKSYIDSCNSRYFFN